MRIVPFALTFSLTLGLAAQNARSGPQTGLDSPLLAQADEEEKLVYIESFVTSEYRHDKFDDGSTGDSTLIHWLQAFGPSKRLAAGIELPIIHESGPAAAGLGDVTLEFRGILGKDEKFEHAAAILVTLPSGSQTLIDEGHILDGQTIFSAGWGCSWALTERTVLSLDTHYHKAVHTRGSAPKRNYVEPVVIVTQAFAKHIAGYLEWDQYFEFSLNQYVQLLKPGVEIAIDRKEKWSISPYAQFPLNRISRIEETKSAAGLVVSYTF